MSVMENNRPKVVPIAQAAPVQAVIDICRELLARAESGELRAIVYIVELLNGSRDLCFSATNDRFALLGNIARMQHRILRQMDDEARQLVEPAR
jgi:hypothetical protein